MTATTVEDSDAADTEDLRELSIGELLSHLGEDSAQLVRQEIELVKAELKERAVSAGVGVGLGVVGLVLLLAALGAGVTAAIAGVNLAMSLWASALIVLGGFALTAGVLLLLAVKRLKAALPPVPERAIQTAKETPHELVS